MHTPGPWTFRKFATTDEDNEMLRKMGREPIRMLMNDGSAAVMAADARIGLVDCQTKFKRGEGHQAECAERDANAHLIAAAPELLAALQRMVEMVQGDVTPSLDVREARLARAQAAIAKATNAQS